MSKFIFLLILPEIVRLVNQMFKKKIEIYFVFFLHIHLIRSFTPKIT